MSGVRRHRSPFFDPHGTVLRMRVSVAVLVLLLMACRGEEGAVPRAEVLSGTTPTVLISTADGVLSAASDLIVGPDGAVYVVDGQASTVHVVDASGTVRDPIGAAGAGPGEFSRPHTLAFLGDTLAVVDYGNGRLQLLDSDLRAFVSRPLPPGQAPALTSSGSFIVPSWGISEDLATIYGPALERRVGIGRIVGEPTNMVRPAEMKEQIARREVPQIFLNTARALGDGAGGVYLIVPARGTVERFDPQGAPLWALQLDEPDADVEFERFVAETARRPVGSFTPLQYIIDAVAVDGDLWVLVPGPEHAAAIRVVHSDGSLGARLEFPGVEEASQVAVDRVRSRIYFVEQDRASLVVLSLPPAF